MREIQRIDFRIPTDAEWLFVLTTLFCTIVSLFFIPNENLESFLLYIAFFSFSIFFVFLSNLTNHTKTSLFLFIIGMFLFGSLMAFRNKTAIDDRTYELVYNYILRDGLNYIFNYSAQEKGYLLLNYVISCLGVNDFCHVITIITYFTFCLWGIALWQYRKKCNLSVMLLLLWSNYYFFVLYAGLIRIFIALPITFIAFDKLAKKNLKAFLICILIATLFHRSAFIMLLFVPLFFDSIQKHWKAFVGALFFLVPLFFLIIAKVIVPILGARYSQYIVTGNIGVSAGNLDTLPIWMLGAYFLQFITENEKKTYIIGMVLLSLSLIFSISSSMVPLGRLIFFANLGILIIASNIFKQKPVGIIEKFIPCIFVAYAFVYVMHTTFLNPVCFDNLYPYQSYLFK